MHKWTNKDAAVPTVELFGSKYNHTEPLQAVASKTKHWGRFWQTLQSKRKADIALKVLRDNALQDREASASVKFIEQEQYTKNAAGYKSRAKRPDHWGADELSRLPPSLMQMILAGLSQSTANLAWALQILCVLAVELGKASGGERTPSHQ